MFDSRVLETAIGLVFLFLGVSLVTTAIQEFVTSIVKLRARTLLAGLKTMMAEDHKGLDLYRKLIAHPVVSPTPGAPSYISAQQFSTGVLNLLCNCGEIPVAVPSVRIAVQNLADSPFKAVLVSLFREGENSLDNFERRLQQWFDHCMERVSGVYKRWSQLISFAIGAALALVFKIDAIAALGALWNTPSLRDAIAANATAASKAAAMASGVDLSPFRFTPIWDAAPTGDLRAFAIGCAITAAAVTLGAPFWFDLLQSFVNLRGTGAVPAPAKATAP